MQITTLRQDNVLMILSNHLTGYQNLSEENHTAHVKKSFPPSIGLESSEETLRFLYESDVEALAEDVSALKARPWQDERSWSHERYLAGRQILSVQIMAGLR